MSPKSTRLLVIVALGLFAYIYFFERHRPGAPPPEQLVPRLLANFDPAQVTGVELTWGTSNIVRVERANDTWRMTVPVNSAADVNAINAFLRTLGELPRETTISARDLVKQPGGLKSYGLETPQASIRLTTGARREEFRVGGRVPLANQVYVQQVGAEGLSVVPAPLLQQFPASVDDWRERAIITPGPGGFDRLRASAGPLRYELQHDRTNQLWRLTEPLPARANQVEVESALQRLLAARASVFVSDLPRPDLETYGLITPQLDLWLGNGTNEAARIRFGGSPTNQPDYVYAQLQPQANVVLVERAVAEAFRPPGTRFRDTRLLSFPTNTADRIEVRADETFALQRQTNGSWRVVEPKDSLADPLLVEFLLYNLNSLQVTEFVRDVVTDFKLYGFTSNSPQYTVLASTTNALGGPTNQVLAQLQLSTNLVQARRTDEASVYGLSRVEAEQLPRAAFQLRHLQVWNFATNQVLSLTVSRDGQAVKLVRSAKGEWTGPATISPEAPFVAEEAAYRLGRLKAMNWVGRGEEKLALWKFAETAHQVTVEVKAGDQVENLTLRFGATSPLRTPFGATMLDGQPVIFFISPDTYNAYELLAGKLGFANSGR